MCSTFAVADAKGWQQRQPACMSACLHVCLHDWQTQRSYSRCFRINIAVDVRRRAAVHTAFRSKVAAHELQPSVPLPPYMDILDICKNLGVWTVTQLCTSQQCCDAWHLNTWNASDSLKRRVCFSTACMASSVLNMFCSKGSGTAAVQVEIQHVGAFSAEHASLTTDDRYGTVSLQGHLSSLHIFTASC